MSMFAKIMVVVNLILAVVFLSFAGTLHGATESYKDKWETTRDKLQKDLDARDVTVKEKDTAIAALNTEKGQLKTNSAAIEATHKQLSESNAALKVEADRLKNEVASQQTNINEMTKSIQDLTKRNEAVTTELNTCQQEKGAALATVATLQENLQRESARADNAEKGLAAGELKNKDLTDQLDKVTTELGGYKKTYPPLGVFASMKAVTGRVAATSAKEDVHVLSVGSRDGVEVGYEFTIFRGSSYIATIVIDQVQNNMCSGRVKPGSKKSDIQAGDEAATRL